MTDKTFKSPSHLIRGFQEKYQIRWGEGGSPLCDPLGTFPFSLELIEALRKESFAIRELEGGTVAVEDRRGISIRRFKRDEKSTLWVWPQPMLDYATRSVACPLVVRTGAGEGFTTLSIPRVCHALAAVHPDCHELIHATADKELVSESWNTLGFGDISALSEIFQSRFVRGRIERQRLANSGLGVFRPNPVPFLFIEDTEVEKLLRKWRSQLGLFKSRL